MGAVLREPTVWQVAAGEQALDSLAVLNDALLAARGVAPTAADFFSPRYERDVHDPHLLHGMASAVEMLYAAAAKGDRVLVHGDYDADGITSTAIIMDTLRGLGVSAAPWLPHRTDHGYGLNRSILSDLIDSFDVLVCVDCGIAHAEEIAWLKEAGKGVIIADHHEIPAVLPPADAVLHPRHPDGAYPFGWLCGAGVSWKLAQALLRDPRSGEDGQATEKWLLDLVCLGTLADVVPLQGENRAVVRFGLEVLRRSRRPGIRALVALLGETAFVDEQTAAFRLVPLLNAAGRVDHPLAALDVLLAETPAAAQPLAEALQRLNRRRRTLSLRVQTEAEQVVAEAAADGLPVLFAADLSWPAGVVGLVAGRLAEKYGRPAFIVGGSGESAVGSARGPAGANVLALLQAGAAHLVRYGGHVGAAGFTVTADNIAALQHALLAAPSIRAAAPMRQADAVVADSLISWETLESLEKFAPFGEGNPKPLLILQDVPVRDIRPVGGRGEHLKLSFEVGGRTIGGIGFGLAETAAIGIKAGGRVDVLFYLEVNVWQGQRSLQLKIEDIASAGTVDIRAAAALAIIKQ